MPFFKAANDGDFMSKRFTKIICTAVAAISAASLAFLPACKTEWGGVSGAKDTSSYVEGTNGGFVAETEDYVYFINGKSSNTADNTFGEVLKGSVQRIKKTDLDAGNYAKTDTVVPSIAYASSDNLNAGLYIYGGYIYYVTPSTDKDADGKVLNDTVKFRRTKLDGTDTSDAFWSTTTLTVDYRYVEVDDTVYIIYAISENLYGTSATNIHSVNCSTGKNTVLAYNVESYAFDTVDATNPYVYYTMKVPQYLGGRDFDYNQLYMVRADASVSPREYDLTDAGDTKYINYGTHVFDGIGQVRYESGVNQFNFVTEYDASIDLNNVADRTYAIKWYRNGTLYYTCKLNDGDVTFYSLDRADIDNDNGGRGDGKVDEGWNAMTDTGTLLVNGNFTIDYEFYNLSDGLYAINASSSGVTKSKVDLEKGEIGDSINVTDASVSKVLYIKEEGEGTDKHVYLYYASAASSSGGNGYAINRVAIDGTEDDYVKLPTSLEPDSTYEAVTVLDLDACSDWYLPEFVGNKLFFASETEGMSSYNYIMVCDLEGANGIMTNKEIKDLNKQFEELEDKIEKYDEEENADGTAAYNHLSSALKYLYNTGDVDYIDELINAYVNIEGRDKEYVYSEKSVEIYKDFAVAEGDWEDYKEITKTINGETVYGNSRDYYYTVVGRMTSGDAERLNAHFKNAYMESYPTVECKTWWEKLSTGGKFGTVFGILEGCMLVIGGGVILGYYLVSRKKAGGSVSERSIDVDLTDDRDMDVYGDESGESGGEND